MEELKDALKQERQLILSIDGVASFAKAFKKEEHQVQLEIRLETLEDAMRKFYKVRRKIELAIDEEDEDFVVPNEAKEARKVRLAALATQREQQYNKAIRDVEEKYFSAKAQLVALRPKKESAVTDHNESIFDRSVSRIKLPDIKLPSFSGNLKEWVPFRDTFRSLIHNNASLPDIDKFTYLRSSLEGKALLEINAVDFSAEYYVVAWETLEETYDNRKLIVKAHLDAIFAVEPVRKESFEALSHLVCEFDQNLQMLKKIGENTDGWSTVMVHLMCSRLDPATLRQWESHHNSKEVSTYAKLIKFLRDQCTVLQSIATNGFREGDVQHPQVSTTLTSSQFQRRCLFCGESFHMPFHCNKLRNLSVAQRVDEVNQRQLCRNCLTSGHFADQCSRGSCTRCGRRHHTLLHYDTAAHAGARQGRSSVPDTQNRTEVAGQHQGNQRPRNQTTQSTNPCPGEQSTSQITRPSPTIDPQNTTTLKAVTLPTRNAPSLSRQLLMSAVVCVEDQFGNLSLARALLDSCSEYCYMSSGFAKKLRFRTSSELLRVQGLGNGTTTSLKAVHAMVQPRLQTISSFAEEMKFHVVQQISNDLPNAPVDVSQLMLPSGIVLADPHFGEPGPIDVIIGADFFLDLLADGKRKTVKNGPRLQETVFGWVVSGKVPVSSSSVPVIHRAPRTSTFLSSTVFLKELRGPVRTCEPATVSYGQSSDNGEEAKKLEKEVTQITDSEIFPQWMSHLSANSDQQLWSLKHTWDEPLEASLQQLWRINVLAADSIRVPRWNMVSNDCIETKCFVFCDASEVAYGAGLPPPAGKDSKIMLEWLASPPIRWKRFVTNRVSRRQHITKEACWGLDLERRTTQTASRGECQSNSIRRSAKSRIARTGRERRQLTQNWWKIEPHLHSYITGIAGQSSSKMLSTLPLPVWKSLTRTSRNRRQRACCLLSPYARRTDTLVEQSRDSVLVPPGTTKI